MNILLIDGGKAYAHSAGRLNHTLHQIARDTLTALGHNVRETVIDDGYDIQQEVEKFQWMDAVIWQMPGWWMHEPWTVKKYIDEVFTAGHDNGIYRNDGRSRKNPDVNYGTGGLMQGKRYMVTTSWNAPQTAFTLEGEFFDRHTVDEGVLFGFHKMNQFVGMTRIEGFHFHDLEKNATPERIAEYHKAYVAHINRVII